MDHTFYAELANDSLRGLEPADALCLQLLTDPEIELLPLLNAAFTVRKAHWGKSVQVHVLNNAANGKCPEDCCYCTQAKTSDVDIEEYPMKSSEEILAEAGRAYASGAFRYCMVFSGRGPSASRAAQLAELVVKIKSTYPLEVCVSAGLVDDEKAKILADAGLDRLNHNLNTSEENYADICTTHAYSDRIETLRAAKRNGLETCSGLIAGMGEPPSSLVEIAKTLRELGAESIPVNFLLPFEGNVLVTPTGLTPEYCLRVLCMYRFVNPTAEIRCAAGREFHLRSLEVMSLYAANSLFLHGYLNAKGSAANRTYQMIVDAGFEIESDFSVDGLIAPRSSAPHEDQPIIVGETSAIKTLEDLRPTR